MIQVHLQFATIAAAVAALVRIDASAIVNGDAPPHAAFTNTGVAPEEKAAVVTPIRPTKPKAEPKTQPAAETQADVTTPPSADTVQTAALAQADKKIEYPVLQKAVFNLVGLCKKAGLDPAEHVLGIARGFDGAANFQALPAEKWADALAAVEAKTVELQAA